MNRPPAPSRFCRTFRQVAIPPALRRAGVAGLLLMFAIFLALAGQDHCHESGSHFHDAPVVHILCADGCVTAPLPEPPRIQPAEGLPRPDYATLLPASPIDRVPEPEEAPPKA